MRPYSAVSGATTGVPDASVSLAPTSDGSALYRAPDVYLNTHPADMGAAGGGAAHANLPPYRAVSFIIAMQVIISLAFLTACPP
jgi:microcystin-dependent protein